MTFREVLAQVIDWLQQDKRVSYRALKRQFELDDAYFDDLKFEIIQVQQLGVDQDGEMLVWTGAPATPEVNDSPWGGSEGRFQTSLLAVMMLLQRDKRVTYRTLTHAYGIDDKLLTEIRKELAFRRMAIDEDGEGLVWTGETPPSVQPGEVAPSQHNTVATTTIPPASLTPPPHVTATDTTTNGPPASPEDVSVESPSDEQITVPEPVRNAPEAERRQLTVMFCDLVGSTDLSSRLDPEDLREVVRAYQGTAAEVIERYEGHIAQYLGDGLLIYFGWPQAHENDAERAVYTGLEIPEAIARLNNRLEADYGVQLAVRIGIHTGPVVVGEMGGGARHENLALGETPNIAARLEGLAQPDTAVISAATAQLVQRSFVLDELGLYELKGVVEPMQLYTVVSLQETEHDDHEGMLAGGFDALVGRDEEIGLLLRRWEQSKEGQGQVVLISGEAGLGKSSLVEGLRAYVRQEGMTRITFRCSPYTANSAMHPVIEHVQRVLGWQRKDSTEIRLDKLEQSLQSTSLPVEETVPLLAALLSLALPEGRYPALTLSPQRQRQLTQDALVAWMLEEADRQPVLAVWEDVHWADPSTLELLGLFIEQTPTVSMLKVLAYRPEFVPPWPMQSHLTPITLNRLERTHIEALVRRLAGGKMLPTEVETHIVTKTDGVPLYVEELTKMLLESDLLEEESDQYTLTGSLSSASIPATLQDSLMARLDRLPELREVAQLGAVLGREFDYEMIQALAALDEPTLQAGLSQLVAHELLYQRGRIPRAKFIFRHVLIRDAAYASLLRRTRQQYHKQVAQLLEVRFSDVVETQPELVAHHYSEARCTAPAINYWQSAGARAVERSANTESITHLTKGLELLETLPKTPARLQQELDFQVALGLALHLTKGHAAPELERAYDRARELCEQVGNTPQLFPVLRGLTVYAQSRGNLQQAHDLGEQLLQLAESHPTSEHRMLAHYQMGQILFHRGEPAPASTHHLQALSMYNPQEHHDLVVRYGNDLGVGAHGFLSWELWHLGYPDQAMQHSEEAHILAQNLSHPYSLTFARVSAAFLSQFRRDALATYEQAEATTTLAVEQGFMLWLAVGTILHGWALAMQGQEEAGIAEMHQGIAAELATGAKTYQAHFLGLLAERYGEVGRLKEGLDVLTEALAMMGPTEVRFYWAELYRLKGQLLLQQSSDNADEAESCFSKASARTRRPSSGWSCALYASASFARPEGRVSSAPVARHSLSP